MGEAGAPTRGLQAQSDNDLRVRRRPVWQQSARKLVRQASKLLPSKKNAPAKVIQEHPHFTWILCGGLILCANAGLVNAVTLLTAHGGASAHVTGLVSRAAISLTSGDMVRFRVNTISYFSFILGAFMSGLTVSYESFYLGRNYGRSLLLIANVQLLAIIIQDILPETEMFLYCCCLACGLQNGIMSKYSGNAIRTTHLTGTTTDLAITLAHILKGRPNEWYKVKILGTCVIGFFTGGIMGYHAFQEYGEMAILVSVVLLSGAGLCHTLYLSYHEGVSLLRILLSKTDFRIHRRRGSASGNADSPSQQDTISRDSFPVRMYGDHYPQGKLSYEDLRQDALRQASIRSQNARPGLLQDIKEEDDDDEKEPVVHTTTIPGVHHPRLDEVLDDDNDEEGSNMLGEKEQDDEELAPEELPESDFVEGDVAIEDPQEILRAYMPPQASLRMGGGGPDRLLLPSHHDDEDSYNMAEFGMSPRRNYGHRGHE